MNKTDDEAVPKIIPFKGVSKACFPLRGRQAIEESTEAANRSETFDTSMEITI